MATTQSQRARSCNTMRKFSDDRRSRVRGSTTSRYFYYLELVNCATVEPFAVQVEFSQGEPGRVGSPCGRA